MPKTVRAMVVKIKRYRYLWDHGYQTRPLCNNESVGLSKCMAHCVLQVEKNKNVKSLTHAEKKSRFTAPVVI